MERNYTGQGSYSGNSQGNLISSGRRAGMVRPPSGDDTGISPSGSDASQGSHVPRFGRRASPGSTRTGGGMDMDPPKYTPSTATGRPAGGAIPRGPIVGASSSAAAMGSAGAAGGAAAGGAGGMSSKLAGLQRLKEASTARLVSRIPSASGSRSSGTGDAGGYVPSAMTNPQPARAPPARANSGGRSGGFGGGAAGASGRGSSAAGPSSSSARSASTGPAMAAAVRPPSGRSTGTAAAGGSSGYGSGSARQPPYGGAPTSAAAGGGRSSAGSIGGGADYGGSAGGGRQPAAAPVAARRPAAAAAPQPPQPKPQPATRAPPPAPPPASHHHHHYNDDVGIGGGFGGGGFGGGGGGAFGAGSIPPGADEAVPAGPMVECPTCGRNFNKQAYSKHAKVCEKVFATKRKPVNMAAKRLEGSEAVKFFDLRKGVPKSEAKPAAAAGGPGRGGAGRGGAAAAGFDDRPLPGSKVPKWKAQSEQLRAAMATNRKIADAKSKGMDIRDLKFEPTPAAQDDRVLCPHCGRKFAELTAERHIPKCKDIMAKPKHLAAGSGRGAHMRR